MADLPHAKYTELFYWLIAILLLSIGPTRSQYIDTVVHATASNCTPISVYGEKEVGEGRGRREEKRRKESHSFMFNICSLLCCSLFKLLCCVLCTNHLWAFWVVVEKVSYLCLFVPLLLYFLQAAFFDHPQRKIMVHVGPPVSPEPQWSPTGRKIPKKTL